MKERIDSIDIFRGIAVLQMIIWQIFDFFYVKNIYADPPYFLTFFNMPINGIGVGLFAFIAGTSVYLSFSKREKLPYHTIIKHFLKRYGGYIFLSIVFTTVVFGFNRFYTWFEAVQGIALAALATGFILLITRSVWVIGLISIGIIVIQPLLRVIVDSIEIFPYEFLSFDISLNAVSIFLNATVRGFFSLSHLLPIALFGVLLGIFIARRKRPENKSLNFGLLFVVASLLMHFTLDSIDYYNRSISYIFFYIGVSYLLFALILYLRLKSSVLVTFGRAALVAYISHYLFIYTPLTLIDLESTFRPLNSWIYTTILVILLYFLCQWWLLNKQNISGGLIRFVSYMEQSGKIALLFSFAWFIISIVSIINLEIKGVYFYIWTGILFSAGSIAMFLIIHVALARKISLRIINYSISALVILGGVTYILWDFDYSLTVKNVLGEDIIADITITNSRGEVVAQTTRSALSISLQKGRYALTVESKGYVTDTSSIINTIGFKRNNDVTQTVVLDPRYINLSQFYFTDPTLSKKLYPLIRVSGLNILNEHVNQTIDAESVLIYGDYFVELIDENFELNTYFKGDTFHDGYRIVLNPNDKFFMLTSKEVSYITNYIYDYLLLNKNLDSKDRGLPRHFYLYHKNEVISLGKMIFLFCEQQVYKENGVENPQYFIPKEMEFMFSNPVPNFAHCYLHALEGRIPEKIADDLLQNIIYKKIVRTQSNFDYPISDLNSEKRILEISFTFDVESGRYVSTDNTPAISPCENEDYSIGLETNELICDDPAFVAWMSPRGGKITYHDYPYPQVSGILGFREILSYSEKYGIPTTNFIVKKDILAFEQLEPELIERTKKLIEESLFEVGSHTSYHTELGMVDLPIARKEVIESKKFLELYFDVKVYGFREPYLSRIGDKHTHEQALIDAGYEYYSNFGPYSNDGIIHKPWNSADFGHDYFSFKTPQDVKQLMDKRLYIITLDHAWNIVYTHEKVVSETIETPDNLRSNILTTISNGAIPVMAKDIKIVE